MYCINCGSEMPEGSKFCPSCGTPVEQPVQQVETPAPEPQPIPVQQVETPAPEPQPIPVQQVETPAPEPQPIPVQQVSAPQAVPAQQPAAPKKKSNLKLWLILGGAGTAVIAAVLVFFLLIFPEITARHVNMGDYVKTSFDSKYYVNGNIKGNIKLDLDKAYTELVEDKTKMSEYEFTSFFDRYFKAEFKNKKLSDTVTTSVAYASKYVDIGGLEKSIGVRFDKTAVANVKIEDEVKKNDVTVEEPVKLDLFSVLNQCYYTKGLSERGISVCMESKEVKKDGYLFRVIGFDGYYGSTSGTVYISKGSDSKGYVEFKADRVKGNKDSKCKISLSFTADENNKELLSGSPFIITKTEKEYTIKPQKGLSAADAESNLGKFRKLARDLYSSGIYSTDITAVYFFSAKDKKDSTVNMVVPVIKKQSKSYKSSKYYIAVIYKNCYIDSKAKKSSEKLKYDSIDSKTDFKSQSNLWNSIKRQYGSKYRIKKIG